jgi:integrase
MSENVELQHLVIDAFNRRDLDAYLALADHDLELTPYEVWVQGGQPYRGHAGVRSWWEARHTCASVMIAAGVNAKALSAIMGHATISMTFDTYGHLMPGGVDEAAAQTNAYLARVGGKRPVLTVAG